MAYVVTELFERRTVSIDDALRRRYTRVFRVDTRGEPSGPLLVATSIPVSLYQIYQNGFGTEYDSGAIAVSIDPQAETLDDPDLWVVTVTYQSWGFDPALISQGQGAGPSHEGGGGLNENPLSMPPQYDWGHSPSRIALWQSLDPQPLKFKNGAGAPITPFPEVDRGHLTLTLTRNEAPPGTNGPVVFDPGRYQSFWNTLNAQRFGDFGPGRVRLNWTTGRSGFANKTAYYTVTYSFDIVKDPEEWKYRVVDKGPYYLAFFADDTVEKVRFKDGATNVLPEGFLKADGTKLGDDDPPHILIYTIYEDADWGPLNLPGYGK